MRCSQDSTTDQRRAAQHAHGPLAVIAGAGTGKTRVLVARVAWLIAAGHARPEQICALTFMNDSAREIAERLERALGAEIAGRVTVGTSHRLANGLLRGCAARFARFGRYSIWDTDQARRALAQRSRPAPKRRATSSVVARLAHRRRPAAALAVAGRRQHARRRPRRRVGRADGLRARQARLGRLRLRRPAAARRGRARIRPRRCGPPLGRRWRYLLLDEVQDTNAAQYRIVALLAEQHRNLMILGDPDQAICAYRGATSAENFAAFARDFPEHRVVTLERNYRSTATILQAANALIAGQPRTRRQAPVDRGARRRARSPSRTATTSSTRRSGSRLGAGPPRRAARTVGAVRPRARQRARRRHRAGAHGRPRPGARGRRARLLRDAPRSATPSPRSPWSPTRATASPSRASRGPPAPASAKRRSRALFAHADAHPQRSLLEHGARSPLDPLRPRQAERGTRAMRRAARRGRAASSAAPARSRDHVIAALVASRQPERLRRTVQSSRSERSRYRARASARTPARARAPRARLRGERAARPTSATSSPDSRSPPATSRDQGEAASVMTDPPRQGPRVRPRVGRGPGGGPPPPRAAPCAKAQSPRSAAWPTSPSPARGARCTPAGRASAADAAREPSRYLAALAHGHRR